MASITISKSSDAIVADLRREHQYIRSSLIFFLPFQHIPSPLQETDFRIVLFLELQRSYQLLLTLGLFLHLTDLN